MSLSSIDLKRLFRNMQILVYSLSEIRDLRPSPTIILASNQISQITFALEESQNLINWNTNQLIKVNIPTTNNIEFFRFRSE